eukprot:TRINITY_DN13062_c0_g1_i1.p1 TRINITY_DN13062_c0_g1~~TRINITY_DN13062_c0_g1_i1.p1  ORF type:complete len:821 (-),score=177.13 TRINITY_DN13062_c0_g1_i1:56-2518(-)
MPRADGSSFFCCETEKELLLEDDAVEASMTLGEGEDIASVIQFTSAFYFVSEGEEDVMQVDIARLGDCSGGAQVCYRTEDSSAKAWVKYVPVSGKLTFEPGDSTKTVHIRILSSEAWDATLEFNVVLEKARGAQLGKYLNVCRVTIIDQNSFPSDKYKEYFPEKCEEIPTFGFFMEYLRLNMRDPTTRSMVWKYMFIDFLKGLYYFWTIYLQVYLIDVVLSEDGGGSGEEARRLVGRPSSARFLEEKEGEEEGGEEEAQFGFMIQSLLVPHSRRETAMVVAAIYVVPFVLLHVSDLCKCYIGLQARLRKMLQANLLRKFLYYDEVVRCDVKGEQIALAMMKDIFEVVDCGFMKVLNVVGILNKLAFALLFILAENKLAALPLCVCPVILILFLTLREKQNINVNEELATKREYVLQCVNDAIQQYRLIADYYMRPMVVTKYEKKIEDFHQQEMHARARRENNLKLSPWLTVLLVGAYMIVGSSIVNTVGGWLRLGVFLATINIFKEIGVEIQEVYAELMEIQRSFGPLIKIAGYMNLRTDLTDRKRINRQRRELGLQERHAARQRTMSLTSESSVGSGFPADTVEIFVQNLTFKFPLGKSVLSDVNLKFAQGKLHALIGAPHGGKATFLKLIGQVFLPLENQGTVFLPPHLRILHASQETILVHGTFTKNIILNQDIKKVGGLERVRQICSLLGFEKDVLSHLDDEVDLSNWTQRLSHTAYARIALARAFVMNPEVLAIHKPLASFNDPEVKTVAGLLRSHVDEKGLALPNNERSFRRPRTVFYSSATLDGIALADLVYKVSNESVDTIQKSLVSMDDLE